jgi:hypothetical protein
LKIWFFLLPRYLINITNIENFYLLAAVNFTFPFNYQLILTSVSPSKLDIISSIMESNTDDNPRKRKADALNTAAPFTASASASAATSTTPGGEDADAELMLDCPVSPTVSCKKT